jgi:hypothetical protein
MGREEGPNRMTRSIKEEMRKKEDTCETSCLRTAQARKASSRKRRPPQVIYPSSHGVITLK